MKVKISEQVRIGSFDFLIKYVAGLASDYKLLGQTIVDRQLIKIDPNTTCQTKGITFFHELFHSVSDVYGCDLSEENIDRLAHGLLSVLERDFGIEFDWSLISENEAVTN